jgi:hypothetical protein
VNTLIANFFIFQIIERMCKFLLITNYCKINKTKPSLHGFVPNNLKVLNAKRTVKSVLKALTIICLRFICNRNVLLHFALGSQPT